MKIYLCCPYSHKDASVIAGRVHRVDQKAAELMDKGYTVFSPVSHSHRIARYTRADALDHDFWLNQDLSFIDWADEVWIYTLDGWRESKGITKEFNYACKLGKPVKFIINR
jgi:nucleoside 2-deoxyribosyltransferase